MTKEETVWLQAWCSVANANDCKTCRTASNWADEALADFNERFRTNENTESAPVVARQTAKT
jgi:hypothetical protein